MPGKLKIGLEIHQQLEGKKLFCSCPTTLREDSPDFSFRRFLHASAGEMGSVDIAAKHESLKKLIYEYQGYNNTTCLVENDDEPPHDLNEDALNVALQVSKVLNMDILDAVQIMRKTVIDGSNTSGFQRTGLVALNGSISTEDGDVGVQTLCLEEDACKIISREEQKLIYRLDRLGVPLIEIATDPDIKSPEQAKEVASYLGMVLRSTGKAKRGIGTIRQDLNVSVDGGNRVEIKGAQDLHLIPQIIELEKQRQLSLNEIAFKVSKNLSIPENFSDLSYIFKNTESKVIKDALKKNHVVLGLILPNFKGLLGKELYSGKRLGTELSDRAKARAGVGGIFHSDELPAYGIVEVDQVRSALKCDTNDAFVLVASSLSKSKAALEAVRERALLCPHGVISEVRKANADGSTSFLRPMPGASRMYPETDVSLVLTDISCIKIPELISEKASRFKEIHDLSPDLARYVAKSGKHDLFESVLNNCSSLKASFVAETILGISKQIQKQFGKEVNPSDEDFKLLFNALDKERISKGSILNILADESPITDAIKKFTLLSEEELQKELQKIVSKNKDAPINSLIGIAMKAFKGKADGKKIKSLIEELI